MHSLAGFDPRTSLQVIERHNITHVTLVPAILHGLANDEGYSFKKTESLKYAFFGEDMVTKDFLRKAKSVLPSAKLGTAYDSYRDA